MMKTLSNNDCKWFKYLLPKDSKDSQITSGVFSLTPWCFYIHGVRGKIELPMHMYTPFTLILNQRERLIIVPDYRLNDVFVDGCFVDNIAKRKRQTHTSSNAEVNLIERDQVILIRDSFFGRKINSVIDLPLIHNNIIRSLLADLSNYDVKTEVTETLHAIANIIFILTAKQQSGKIKHEPIEIVIDAIMNNYKDKKFNLDKLSSIALMSRRKVQYTISEMEETFTSLVSKARVEEIKKIINKNPRVSLAELTDSAGMKNSYSTSKTFYKYEGVSIKEYRNMCRMLIK